MPLPYWAYGACNHIFYRLIDTQWLMWSTLCHLPSLSTAIFPGTHFMLGQPESPGQLNFLQSILLPTRVSWCLLTDGCAEHVLQGCPGYHELTKKLWPTEVTLDHKMHRTREYIKTWSWWQEVRKKQPEKQCFNLPKFSCNISVSIFEYQNGGLVYLKKKKKS